MTRSALIVAHGSPSDPDPQEAALKDLAARVGALLPGWRIGGATLAKEGAFDAAVADLGAPWIYPYFMARGYFTKKVLAERAEPLGLRVLEPFGTEPALVTSAAHALQRALGDKGWQAAETTLLVAAHGSNVSRTSAESARDFAAALEAEIGFAKARVGYVEEPPYLNESARGLGQAICLPQFALNAGHMLEDVPEALAEADFAGPVLPAFIDWPEIPELIAQSLETQASSA
ncbi:MULTISPECIES: CbiX/SirB N-terminal domain-containing protein [Roseobacteraceae]|uniref:CbiX/SirB N-terminal domain-containing protein n=1 Tax=Roseobacteraceae TaxID=2854170 RepID=UPI0013BC228C|nr:MULTISPECIES: CbiX/SirB N-terminal domain-containing protein [unclassified Salipiger]NDV50461.1 cobalamin biosynthesis protein CbiX [Salipiger sp. PrR003]NDW32646.1 cobalamin biosynthesis protein CbiX [Salipiger sp. PrR007]